MLYTWPFLSQVRFGKHPAIQVELEPSTTSKRMVFLLGNWAGLPNLGKLWQAKGYTAAANDFLYKNHGKNVLYMFMVTHVPRKSHAIFKRDSRVAMH